MELIRTKTHIDFVRHRKVAFLLSFFLLCVSLLSFGIQSLNFGIDFVGGTLVQLRFDRPTSTQKIRLSLSELDLGDVVIQEFGAPDEILIRVEKQASDPGERAHLAQRIVDTLHSTSGNSENGAARKVEVRRVEFVGPQVGEELTTQGILAVIYAMVAILAYVAWRFELRFAYGAVLALTHDVLITLGILSILQREFTLVVVAALLTVIGYSLNDTIVVYDRIREEMRRLKKKSLEFIVNEAINRTLARTLVTSLTTTLVLTALLLFGGEVIYDFALTLFIGVLIGTYSSVFVASPMILLLDPTQRKQVPKENR